MSSSVHFERVAAHYAQVWGRAGAPVPPPPSPRRHELPDEFAILEFAPYGERQMWTYATCGMSQSDDQLPLELHLFSSDASRELVELLTAVAHYHRTGSPLAVGHTVNFGKPWLDDSACDHGLVSLPYLDGPELENLRLPEGPTVKFDWLIPITPAEVDFKKANGLEALEERMEEAGFNYLDPNRPSVC
jgi:Suppressor of fused protein (SUFU)